MDYVKGQLTFHTGPKPIEQHLENLIDSFIENQEEGRLECTVDSIVFEIIKFSKDFMNKDRNGSIDIFKETIFFQN